MRFTEIEDYIGAATKLEGNGKIMYKLLINEKHELHIQFVENEEDGTFSDIVFSVAMYAPERHSRHVLKELEGYDPSTGKLVRRRDNNNGGFLKAVLKHLCSGEQVPDSLLRMLS